MNRYETFNAAIRNAEELLELRRRQVVLTEQLIKALKKERDK